jgi:hypothetical protein
MRGEFKFVKMRSDVQEPDLMGGTLGTSWHVTTESSSVINRTAWYVNHMVE